MACQYVMYENDAVDVYFVDGARLELSPCGAEFSCTHCSDARRQVQRTQFATSNYLSFVADAVAFRNRFACRVYLCADLLPADAIKKLHYDCSDIHWDSELEPHDHEDGSVSVTSADEFVTVTMAANRQHVTIRRLVQLSRLNNKNRKGGRYSEQLPQSASCWDCCWVTQHMSLKEVWDCWQHPVTCLLQHCRAQRALSVSFQGDTPADCDVRRTEREVTSGALSPALQCDEISNVITVKNLLRRDLSRCVKVPVPEALPRSCIRPHLHTWSSGGTGSEVTTSLADNLELSGTLRNCGKLKVLCSQGVVYRLLWGGALCVEVYPGDGSTLRSHGLSGQYYTHHYTRSDTKVCEETTYSVTTCPPDIPGSPYSLRKLIARASRLFEYMQQQNIQLIPSEVKCCWKPVSCETLPLCTEPARLLEQAHVPGQGHFTAFTSGRVYVTFTDRTCVETYADLSPRLQQMGLGEERHILPRDAQVGECRVLLPSGHYTSSSFDQPGKLHRHVSLVQQWVRWVNTPPGERGDFYSREDLAAEDPVLSVQHEISKISRFNYIVDNTILQQQPDTKAHRHSLPASVTESVTSPESDDVTVMDLRTVAEALRQTHAAVRDLDLYLCQDSADAAE